MVQDVEGTFNVDGQSLYTRSWLPDGSIKAKLVLVHGFSDHMGLYVDFGRALATAGIAVYGLDQRGWGKSVTRPAGRGRTGPTARVVADIAAFIAAQLPAPASSPQEEPPVFVMGHSLGGGVVLALASDATHEDAVVSRVRGWLLESPLLGWPEGESPSWLKVFAGRLVGRVLPHMHMAYKIPPEYLSRDDAVCRRIAADELCHDLGTLEGLAGTLDRTAALADGTLSLRTPAVKSLWLGHATLDKAVSYDASKKWFDAHSGGVPDRTFRPYEGWFHQLHNDTEKELYFGHVIEWIIERSGGAATAAPAAEAKDAAVAAPAAEKKDEGNTEPEPVRPAEVNANVEAKPEPKL